MLLWYERSQACCCCSGACTSHWIISRKPFRSEKSEHRRSAPRSIVAPAALVVVEVVATSDEAPGHESWQSWHRLVQRRPLEIAFRVVFSTRSREKCQHSSCHIPCNWFSMFFPCFFHMAFVKKKPCTCSFQGAVAFPAAAWAVVETCNGWQLPTTARRHSASSCRRCWSSWCSSACCWLSCCILSAAPFGCQSDGDVEHQTFHGRSTTLQLTELQCSIQ